VASRARQDGPGRDDGPGPSASAAEHVRRGPAGTRAVPSGVHRSANIVMGEGLEKKEHWNPFGFVLAVEAAVGLALYVERGRCGCGLFAVLVHQHHEGGCEEGQSGQEKGVSKKGSGVHRFGVWLCSSLQLLRASSDRQEPVDQRPCCNSVYRAKQQLKRCIPGGFLAAQLQRGNNARAHAT
jgi:hypothetical protein